MSVMSRPYALMVVTIALVPLLSMAQMDGGNCDPKRSLHGACDDVGSACYEIDGFNQCAAPKKKGKVCTHSRECDKGLRCVKTKCVVAISLGKKCENAYWPCGKEGFCDTRRNKCVPFRLEGDSCSKWFECESDLSCLDGECAARSKPGETCAVDQDCVSDAFCNTEDGECISTGRIGASCAGPLQCKSDFDCVEGECARRPKKATAADSSKDEDEDEDEDKDTDELDELDFGDEKESKKEKEDQSFWERWWRVIIGASVGGAVLLILLLLLCCCCIRKRRDKSYTEKFAGHSGAFSTYSSQA